MQNFSGKTWMMYHTQFLALRKKSKGNQKFTSQGDYALDLNHHCFLIDSFAWLQ